MFEIAAGIFIAFAVLCIVAFAVAICADAWATSPHPTRRQMREAIDRYGRPNGSNSTHRRLMSDDDPRRRD
jgi:hypothetical protein